MCKDPNFIEGNCYDVVVHQEGTYVWLDNDDYEVVHIEHDLLPLVAQRLLQIYWNGM